MTANTLYDSVRSYAIHVKFNSLTSLRYQCWLDSAGKQTQQSETETLYIKKPAGSGAVFSGIRNSYLLPVFVTNSPVQPQSESLQCHLNTYAFPSTDQVS
jgi:hypothetical protein